MTEAVATAINWVGIWGEVGWPTTFAHNRSLQFEPCEADFDTPLRSDALAWVQGQVAESVCVELSLSQMSDLQITSAL